MQRKIEDIVILDELSLSDLDTITVRLSGEGAEAKAKMFDKLYDLINRHISTKEERTSIEVLEKLQNYCIDNNIELNKVDFTKAFKTYTKNGNFELSIENTKIKS